MGIEAIWSALLTVGITAIGFLIKEMKNTLDKQLTKQSEQLEKMEDRHDKRFKELEDRFADFRAELPSKYVNRDDFVRAMLGIDNSIDKGITAIRDQIREIQGGG